MDQKWVGNKNKFKTQTFISKFYSKSRRHTTSEPVAVL